MSSNPRELDPFYVKLRAVLLAYTETGDPSAEVAADFRRDLVQAWTSQLRLDTLVPAKAAQRLHQELMNALVGLAVALQAAARADENASLPLEDLLVSQVCCAP